jgi:hypothetical protein
MKNIRQQPCNKETAAAQANEMTKDLDVISQLLPHN